MVSGGVCSNTLIGCTSLTTTVIINVSLLFQTDYACTDLLFASISFGTSSWFRIPSSHACAEQKHHNRNAKGNEKEKGNQRLGLIADRRGFIAVVPLTLCETAVLLPLYVFPLLYKLT